MSEEVADALAEAADELAAQADQHIGVGVHAEEQVKQLRRDAMFLRRKAVAIRGHIVDINYTIVP